MEETIHVEHVAGDQFRIAVRGHELVVDQPGSGSPGAGPTPTELFIAGLASCIGFFAGRYLVRHQLPTEGLRVTTDYAIGGRPARVTDISVKLYLPDGVPDDRVPALLAVASRCTIHNSLHETPDVAIEIADREPAPTGTG
jgi:uncharacterized OsmC-like protein